MAVFEEIVGNIKKIGLKKPVTVTPRNDLEDGNATVDLWRRQAQGVQVTW